MKFKKVRSARIRTHNLRIWGYVNLPHDYGGKYNFIELSMDFIASLFP